LLIDTDAVPSVAQFCAVEFVLLVSARPLFVTFTDLVALHPLASVIVTLYVPAFRPVLFCVVLPLVHKKLNGAVPFDALAVAEPRVAQLWAVAFAVVLRTTELLITVTEFVPLQPFASVIVTL
jgi:hypothetical protein